jgi:hypothetical protein
VAAAVHELAGNRSAWDARAKAAKRRITDAWHRRAAALPQAMQAMLA